MSNSKDVMSPIPVERRALPDLSLHLDELPVERVLGVHWFVQTDELGFENKNLNCPESKHGILSSVFCLFTVWPFWFCCACGPLWKAKLDWDQPLEEHFLKRWRSCTTQSSLSELCIPLRYFPPEMDTFKCKLQLHIFSDVSEIGYGACAYLRMEDPNGPTHCSFIMGKAWNAPVKFTSIPRLELQAAVLATCLHSMLGEELDLCI